MYILNAGYQEYHYFTVSLSITDEFGSSHTFGKDSVSVNNPKLPTVDFDEEINILEVIFTAFTTSDGEIISYHWDFGDTTTVADTSDLQSSTYTYPAPGIYPVSLTVIDSYGLSAGGDTTTNISVYPSEDPPSANFHWVADLLQVTFTDLSVAGDTTITNWSWNFGDGDTSTEQNVVYTYTSAGTYSVSLTVTDANGLSNISTQSVTVTSVLVGPTANFTHSNSYLIIQFTDASQAGDGVINNWSWDFGNGSTSTEQNPVHEYATADTFIVSLTVTDENNLTDTYSDSIITVENLQIGPSASFAFSTDGLTVTFSDLSSAEKGAPNFRVIDFNYIPSFDEVFPQSAKNNVPLEEWKTIAEALDCQNSLEPLATELWRERKHRKKIEKKWSRHHIAYFEICHEVHKGKRAILPELLAF